MNSPHYHLVLNHLPIIAPIVGLLVLIAGFVFHSDIIKRTSFFIFIFAALTAIAAFATGEGASDAIEHLPGFSKQLIDRHEELAEIFSILIYLLGAASLITLWANWKKKSYSNLLSWFIMGFCIVVLFFAKQTGTSGGEIRHTEIRTDTTANLGKTNQNQNDN
jgi:uncharacterized membrane protein